MPYFVVPQNAKLKDHLDQMPFDTFFKARDHAQQLKNKSGGQYTVISISQEYTTQTIKDMLGS